MRKAAYHDARRWKGGVGQMRRSNRNRVQGTGTWRVKYQLSSRDKAVSTRYTKAVHQNTGRVEQRQGRGWNSSGATRTIDGGRVGWLSQCQTIGGAKCWAAEEEREHGRTANLQGEGSSPACARMEQVLTGERERQRQRWHVSREPASVGLSAKQAQSQVRRRPAKPTRGGYTRPRGATVSCCRHAGDR